MVRKLLRVRKVNAPAHSVEAVEERPAWVETSRWTSPWHMQPKRKNYGGAQGAVDLVRDKRRDHVLRLQRAVPPINDTWGTFAPVSERNLHFSHRSQEAMHDSYPVVRHSFLFSKASVDICAGPRPRQTPHQTTKLFQLPMRLVATTMEEQHPCLPVVSPIQPVTPLASHLRKNRRRPYHRRGLDSILAMSPGSPESPLRSNPWNIWGADESPVATVAHEARQMEGDGDGTQRQPTVRADEASESNTPDRRQKAGAGLGMEHHFPAQSSEDPMAVPTGEYSSRQTDKCAAGKSFKYVPATSRTGERPEGIGWRKRPQS